MKVYVFSGTTEGREISEFLSARGMEHEVFVATEYGEEVMSPSTYAHVHMGRMDTSEMTALFKKIDGVIIDATHPFATIVTENIKEAVALAGGRLEYIRVQRDIGNVGSIQTNADGIIVNSTEEAIGELQKIDGNILLTTGVKTINEYVKALGAERIIARILPSVESLTLALNAGLKPKQIIAMEGPFSTKVNEALIDQFNIGILVTKNSGAKGGIAEKLEACRNKEIKAVVIENKVKEEGIPISIALEKLDMIISKDNQSIKNSTNRKEIIIAGIGVGNKESMTIAVYEAIKNAEVIIGAKRMLEVGKSINSTARCEEEYKPSNILEIIKSSQETKIVILVSGDTGFFSLATSLKEKLQENDFAPVVLPGVSSISFFCAKAGIPYSDSMLISNHGKTEDICRALSIKNRAYAILSGVKDLNFMIREIASSKLKARIYVGYNLGLSDEEIFEFDIDEIREFTQEGLYVLGVSLYE